MYCSLFRVRVGTNVLVDSRRPCSLGTYLYYIIRTPLELCIIEDTYYYNIILYTSICTCRRIRRSRIAKSVATVTDDNNIVVASISYIFFYTDAIQNFFWPSRGGISSAVVVTAAAVLYTDENLKSVWWVGSGQDRYYRLVEMRSAGGITTKWLRLTKNQTIIQLW